MAKAPRSWKVDTHDAIQKLENNMWAVQGMVHKGPLKRHMVLVKLASGQLVVYNAVPCDEPSMKELEGWGNMSYLVVPAPDHRIDCNAWSKRFPKSRVVSAAESAAKVSQVVDRHGSLDLLPADAGLKAGSVGGMRGETYLQITHADGGVTLVVADALFNVPAGSVSGFPGLMFKLLGFMGGPGLPWLVRRFVVPDIQSYKRQLLAWAEIPKLKRIIVSHGDAITDQPADVLRSVAARF